MADETGKEREGTMKKPRAKSLTQAESIYLGRLVFELSQDIAGGRRKPVEVQEWIPEAAEKLGRDLTVSQVEAASQANKLSWGACFLPQSEAIRRPAIAETNKRLDAISNDIILMGMTLAAVAAQVEAVHALVSSVAGLMHDQQNSQGK
jgi:hypothetical protein